MIIQTERLILRPWKEEDLLPFSKLNADPQVMEFFPKTLSLEETTSVFNIFNERFRRDGFSFMATELRSTGEFIGFVGLNKPAFEAPFMPAVEIGWRIAASHWNKGYATEGARGALKFGFSELGLKEIVSFTAEINVRSIRIMEKINMIQDLKGTFMHPLVSEDSPLKKHVLYRIRAQE